MLYYDAPEVRLAARSPGAARYLLIFLLSVLLTFRILHVAWHSPSMRRFLSTTNCLSLPRTLMPSPGNLRHAPTTPRPVPIVPPAALPFSALPLSMSMQRLSPPSEQGEPSKMGTATSGHSFPIVAFTNGVSLASVGIWVYVRHGASRRGYCTRLLSPPIAMVAMSSIPPYPFVLMGLAVFDVCHA